MEEKHSTVLSIIKVCTLCKQEKTLNLFAKGKKNKDGYRNQCLDCVRKVLKAYQKSPQGKLARWKASIKDKFNLTPEQYQCILLGQNNRCAVCKTHQTNLRKRLAVDHCHKTGKIRGLLCQDCNTSLGLVKEDIEICNELINYIKSNAT